MRDTGGRMKKDSVSHVSFRAKRGTFANASPDASPLRMTGSNAPSAKAPLTSILSDPIMKSTWIGLTLPPRTAKSSSDGAPPSRSVNCKPMRLAAFSSSSVLSKRTPAKESPQSGKRLWGLAWLTAKLLVRHCRYGNTPGNNVFFSCRL